VSGDGCDEAVDQARAGGRHGRDRVHGGDGGGGSGPRLAGEQSYADAEVVVSQIRDGGGGMPAFGDQLSEQELADVSAHVIQLAGG